MIEGQDLEWRASSEETVEERGEVFGLRVRAVSHRGSLARIEYAAQGSGEGPSTIASTIVSCSRATAANPLSCVQRFMHRGWMFTFRHRLSDLPSWWPMQQRLIALLDSFVVAGGDALAVRSRGRAQPPLR
ncbi:MAG: hypothetical protein ACREH3_20140 [Geminicoccales bacterium]